MGAPGEGGLTLSELRLGGGARPDRPRMRWDPSFTSFGEAQASLHRAAAEVRFAAGLGAASGRAAVWGADARWLRAGLLAADASEPSSLAR